MPSPSRASKSAAASAAARSCRITIAARSRDGALDGWHLEICWLHGPVDVLFAQIQGSARIRLEDGTILRVNYDSHNGWPYTPVGRVLIDRKADPQGRNVDAAHPRLDGGQSGPGQRSAARRTNLTCSSASPISPPRMRRSAPKALPLVPGRSIAVDHALHVYGTPFLHRRRFAARQRKGGDEIPPPDGRAGYRLGDRRSGARRHLFRRRRRGGAHGRPHQESRRFRDAACRARSIRSRPGAICRCRRSGRARSALSVTTMEDPTAVDVPVPEPKPASSRRRNPPPPRLRRSESRDQSHEPAPAIERRRTRLCGPASPARSSR